MHVESNPGAATPQSLYQMYEKHAATTGNPYVLRGIQNTSNPRKHGRTGYRAVPTNQPSSLAVTHSHVTPLNTRPCPNMYLTQTPHATNSRGQLPKQQQYGTSFVKHGVINQLIHPNGSRPNNRTHTACSNPLHPAQYSPAEAAIRNAARGLIHNNAM